MSTSTYTKALADEICARLAKGEPLAAICRDAHMPAKRTVSDWKVAHPEFAEAVQDARDDGYDAIAAGTLLIADDARNDFMEQLKADGTSDVVFNSEHVQRSKLRIDTRLKLLAKWDPKRYGDKVTHVGDAAEPLQVAHSGTVALDPSEAYLRMLNRGS